MTAHITVLEGECSIYTFRKEGYINHQQKEDYTKTFTTRTKNFNIEDEAYGARKPVIRSFNATVADGTLEIRFYWASRGTIRIPNRGDYGSLVSAISVYPSDRVCSDGMKKNITAYIVAPLVVVLFILSGLGFLLWSRNVKRRKQAGKDFEGLELQTVAYCKQDWRRWFRSRVQGSTT